MNPLFNVTEEDIGRLGPIGLADFANRLLRAEGSRIGLPPTCIHTTLRVNIPDAGVDALVSDNDRASDWIPLGTSVWQFKSGADHAPTTLRAEFHKADVIDVLKAGGSYCVVVSDDLGNIERKNRVKALEDCCHEEGIATDRVKLLAADKVAAWARIHPSMRLLLGGASPGGLYRWEQWASNPRFRQEFKSDQQRSDIINQVRHGLNDPSGPVRVGIQGLAGIGKSRLGLESLRAVNASDGLPERVLYADNPNAVPADLFHWMQVNPQAKLILVVDECEGQEAERLETQARRSDGRLRLVTIGQAREYRLYDLSRPHTFLLEKLDDQSMRDLLKTATPGLDEASYTFAVSVASGFVKIAIRLSEAMLRHPVRASARDLALDYDVHDVVKQFLVPDETDLRVMRALALLSRVGWEGELEEEGQVVIKYMGLDWHDAKSRVRRLTDEGIIAKQGRYRYVTPHLLAVWLASQVWEDYGEEIVKILNDLPSQTSGRAFLERLRDIGDDPRARSVCEMMLAPNGIFSELSILNDQSRSQVFALLAEAHPQAGLRALQRLLEGLPRDDLMQFMAGRRQVVWLLEKLAWLPDTFEGAARLLMLLAEAENESWGNNASGIWVGLFGTYLGNTAVPALQRHILISEALNHNSLERQLLAVRAISRVFVIQEIGSVQGETQGGRVAPPRWRPNTWEEDRQVRFSGLELLDCALTSERETVREAAWKMLLDHARDLVILGLADALADRLEGHIYRDYEERRQVVRTMGSVLEFEGQRLTPEQRKRLEVLCDDLEGNSFGERLRLWTGDLTRRAWRDPNVKFHDAVQQRATEREQTSAALADEVMQSPDLLKGEWDWLGSAPFVYFFARRLGELDGSRQFWRNIEALVRQDKGHALAAGYLQGQADGGRDWRGEVIARWAEEGPEMALAVMDLIWRGTPDDADARLLATLVERGLIDGSRLGAFTFSALPRMVSIEAFLSLMRTVLTDPSGAATSSAMGLLSQRLSLHPEDHGNVAPLVWEVLEREPLLAGEQHYIAMDMALSYIPDNPVRVARVALRQFTTANPPMIRENPFVNMLAEATKSDPQRVWTEVASWLTGKYGENGSTALYFSLRGWYGQLVGTDILIPWAKSSLPEGPRLAAVLTNVQPASQNAIAEGERDEAAIETRPLDPLVRELLITFENDPSVGSSLAANFATGTFWGNLSEWLRAHQENARAWQDDPAPAVRRWVARLIEGLQRQIDEVLIHEEEGAF